MTKLLSFALRVVCILLVGGLFLVMLIAWKSGGSLPQAVLDCPAQAAAVDSSSPVQARCGLGTRWELNEACWRGVYVRRGNSNVFDAEWTLLDGRRFTAEITIEIQGNRVFVQRRRATRDGDADLVNGTLGADGVTVTGVISGRHGSGCFFARIICDDRPGADVSGGCGLGARWEETEEGWTAIWTRRGNSNVFDLRATKGGMILTAVQTININGNRVSIIRTNVSDGNDCEMEGTIAQDGVTVTGTYRCRSGGPYAWRATIRCQ